MAANPVEPDLYALHQSLPDLLRNLLRNLLRHLVEPGLALRQGFLEPSPEPLPEPCWTWPGCAPKPPRPSPEPSPEPCWTRPGSAPKPQSDSPEPSEPSPEPRWTWPGACASARRSYCGLKIPWAYAVGEKGLTISNLQRPIQSPCEEPYFPQRTRRSIDPWRTRTHMAHTSQPKMMTRLTTCSHWFDHILSLFSCRCHMPWLCYHVHAFAPMPCFLFLFLSVISWFAFPPRAKRRNYSAWRTGAQKVSLPPKLLHSLLAHAPLCNTHRQNYLPQFLVAPWRPNKMDRIDLRRPVSKVTYQLWVAQLVLREWFCLNWTPFSAVYVWTCFGPLSCLVESESWSFNLWDGHGLFKHLSDNGQVAHFDPTFARQ